MALPRPLLLVLEFVHCSLAVGPLKPKQLISPCAFPPRSGKGRWGMDSTKAKHARRSGCRTIMRSRTGSARRACRGLRKAVGVRSRRRDPARFRFLVLPNRRFAIKMGAYVTEWAASNRAL